jgi:hypothetical protein
LDAEGHQARANVNLLLLTVKLSCFHVLLLLQVPAGCSSVA